MERVRKKLAAGNINLSQIPVNAPPFATLPPRGGTIFQQGVKVKKSCSIT